MSIHHESAFETEICEYLAAHGWIYEPEAKDRGYDRVRALYPPDLFAWLEETQPEQLAKVVKPESPATEQAHAREQLLDRLVKTLDLPLDQGGGTLTALRQGFKKTPASFTLAQFAPNTTLNEQANRRFAQNRLRVVRQVHYSTKNENSIDLVLFVNGLPVATIELKTDNTQSLDDAVAQYRQQRNPRGEPLLGFAHRALVHFAVSTDRIAMTTRLEGAATRFVPFDRGYDDGAGNPPTPGKAATAYLWERVLDRDAFLFVLGRLLHLQKTVATDPITGESTTSTSLLFPRFHQWELVTELLATARREGAGERYLVQHSAGSGKTNSIAWLAHGLSGLHDEHNDKVFDTVIVVTDRTVLDDQLQRAVRQIEGVDGTVATINADEVRRAGEASKSALLARELLAGKLIVIVTLQTFPYALDAIREHASLAERRFAIIADEAHSSQTGRASQKLRVALTLDELADLDDGGEIDIESVLAAEMTARASAPNLSFFAFTATPKTKTLELFGRPDPGDPECLPRPFHVYSMRQAIEEGYILDVLRNYTTYDTAFRIAERSKPHLEALDLVDESEATRGLMRWVSLHPTNIAQKVQIIVEHFRENVAHLLDGHAKAMIVTSSREAAVRYKQAIDAYIAKRGYRLRTLVAFSGTLTQDEVSGVAFAHAAPPYSEANLNQGLRGRTLPVAFASDDFSILIVANKYQTGFDQPLLCAMYVDKRLAGVSAVQTLSRLNRTYPAAGKDQTFVLDFVNDPDEILESFQTYYRTAWLGDATDIDRVHDVMTKLDAEGIYTADEIETFVDAFVRGSLGAGPSHGAHTAPLSAAARRFSERYRTAEAEGDKGEIERLNIFRKDVGTFVRLYDFLSQIIDYADTSLEKHALFLRLLLPRLTDRSPSDAIDFSAVELTHIKQARSGEHRLDLDSGAAAPLRPVEPGGGAARDPRLVRLAEILARINELFAGEDFSASGLESWVQGVVTVLGDDPQIRLQAAVNTERQFTESPDLGDAVTDAVISNQSTHNGIVDLFFGRPELKSQLIRRLGELVWENLRIEREDDAAS